MGLTAGRDTIDTNEPVEPYDPLNYDNLARSVVQALFDRTEQPVPPPEMFSGAGVYAIYYHGDLSLYEKIFKLRPERPIYVGKAVPAGARKGKGPSSASTGRELYNRLNEHAKSLEQARNLRLDAFGCRYLVVVPVWIPLAERFLVEHYRPVWNVLIDGFGNHDPGRGRVAMKRPRWDILHPGRPWADRLRAEESVEDVVMRLKTFLGQWAT